MYTFHILDGRFNEDRFFDKGRIMNNKFLEKYAELAIKVGVNLQKGEMLVINAPVTAAKFVEILTKRAYKCGARNVEIQWGDEAISKLGFKYRSKKELGKVPEWIKRRSDYYIDEKIAYLNVFSENPEALKGVNPEKVAIFRRAKGRALERFRDYTGSNKLRWCIIAYPNKAWAKKMFPELSASAALEKQWEYIAKTVRLDEDDAVKAWQEHQNRIVKRCEALNKAEIKSFTYKNSLGTNVTVGMPTGYIFCGGAEKGELDGVYFTANMPTEEVFSCPDKNSVNGKIVASMPLCRNGQIIDGFWFEFKDGKIVNYGAEQGYDNLKTIIETDEGSRYLGEIALVGYNSPIRNLETMFYETLFDENASCHFAIGDCYPTCLVGGGEMTKEELAKHGLNTSIEHVDFMVGTKDLEITAETSGGEEIKIFENGEWAI